jgi:4-diphosphocytidyl-2-C-methyl-D-erythritol kinase
MSALQETAYAKLNLALHVRRRRDDGYHELETLFAFADDGDRISGELAKDVSLSVSGRFGDCLSNTDNLVVKTACLVKAHFGVEHGAALHLDKQLPVASGIGGGSADAAATARLLNRLWNIDAEEAELEALLTPLGADIPACVRSRTAYGEGTGATVRSVPDAGIRGRAVLLVNPGQPVATGPVFKAWDNIDRGPLDASDPLQAAFQGRNDLEAPAISICPAIGDALEILAQTDADFIRMSGSGATCFALYASDAARDTARRSVDRTCPDWWTMSSLLR